MIQVAEKPSLQPMQHGSFDYQQQSDESGRVVQVVIVETHLLMREALQRIIESFSHIHVTAGPPRMQDVPAP